MCQSVFKRNHSKDFCLAQLINFVLAGMDKQMHTSMILADLQEAFDTLDHRVRTSVIKWFESYLSNRKLWVCSDCFLCGWNIKVRCTTRHYSWTATFSIVYRWSSPIMIRNWLLLVCRWQLYFLPVHRCLKKMKMFQMEIFRHYASGSLTVTCRFILEKIKLNLLSFQRQEV